jgi:sn-glycerol 3-phosphate transport system ATP-binding protein
MSFVTFKNVSKRFDIQDVLTDINFSVSRGEFVVLVGPSGCGKSTLLRMLAGLESISDGKILLDNRCINQMKPVERDMAMVFQSYALYPHMTVYQNMSYSLKLKHLPKAEIDAKVREAAQMLQIEPLLLRKPAELSGGQRQRVAMGRAMVRHPSVFLFDEPLSNLDSNLRAEMRYEIKRLHEKLKATSIYVTHDQTEAMTMADRVIVLNGGRIEQIDEPMQLYNQPQTQFVAQFTGHYPVNQVPAIVSKDSKRVELPGKIAMINQQLENANLTADTAVNLIIRPEHVQVSHERGMLKGDVIFVENMGADLLLRVSVFGYEMPFVVRVAATHSFVHNEVYLSFDWQKVSVFDAETGQRI